jgi:hypothetical protein
VRVEHPGDETELSQGAFVRDTVAVGLGDECRPGGYGDLAGVILLLTFGTFGLVLCWPIGIVMDAEGIRIGGIRRAAKRARKQGRDINRQRGEVFFCPWEAVQRMEVVTDRRELKKLRQAAPDIGISRSNLVALGRAQIVVGWTGGRTPLSARRANSRSASSSASAASMPMPTQPVW